MNYFSFQKVLFYLVYQCLKDIQVRKLLIKDQIKTQVYIYIIQCILSSSSQNKNKSKQLFRFISTHQETARLLQLNPSYHQLGPPHKIIVTTEARLTAKMRRKASIGSLLQIISRGSASRTGSELHLKATCGVTFIPEVSISLSPDHTHRVLRKNVNG